MPFRNREEKREYMRRYYQDHKEAYGAASKKSYVKRREYVCDKTGKWNRENPTKVSDYQRRSRQKLRAQILAHYGAVCVCCGERHVEFLTIDHINGCDKRPKDFYRWIVKNGYPDDLQVLCWNCNCAKGVYGRCPHRKEEPSAGDL